MNGTVGPQLQRAVIQRPAIRRIVERALDEDLGRGDVTTDACVSQEARGQIRVVARESLVVCGVDVLREVYRQLDDSGTAGVVLEVVAEDGTPIAAQQSLARLSGPAHLILNGERVALNFMQRMSAVATLTKRYVDALPDGSTTRITDTRKTTPGLRALERYAVRCGGGFNHRNDLSSAVLIKDNHIAAAGGVAAAIASARQHAPHTHRIECEVDSLQQLDIALSCGVDIVLLDNFELDDVHEAVDKVAGRALVELSGGVRVDQVQGLARAGADIISVGALTHSAGAVDLGFDWDDIG